MPRTVVFEASIDVIGGGPNRLSDKSLLFLADRHY
jgi:hypothetical protein